jgi:hypothetical protein
VKTLGGTLTAHRKPQRRHGEWLGFPHPTDRRTPKEKFLQLICGH